MKKRINFVNIALILIVVFSIFLQFKNLGDRTLWEDEAQTAVLARQVVAHGLPMFTEGETNIPTDRSDLSDFNDKKIFIWNTWFPHYITAASFISFGESTWSARLPFALFGVLSVLLYAAICLRLFGQNKRLLIISFVMLAMSVPLLLHVRQCRYYSIIIFGTLWMIWGYISVLEGKKRGMFHLVAGGILCFYSFYVIPVFNLGAIFLHSLITDRRKEKILKTLVSSFLVVLAALPALLYMRLWNTRPDDPLSIPDMGRSIWVYILWINVFILPFALPVLYAVFSRTKWWFLLAAAYLIFLLGAVFDHQLFQWITLAGLVVSAVIFSLKVDMAGVLSGGEFSDRDSLQLLRRFLSLAAIMVGIYVLGLSVISRYPFPRYLMPVVPLILIFGSMLINNIISRNRVVGWVLFALILATNLIGALPLKAVNIAFSDDEKKMEYSVLPRELWWWTELRSDLFGFIYEITHNINDPEKALVSYFKENGRSGEGIKTTYGGASFMFYLPEMRIISGWDTHGEIPDYLIFRNPYPFPWEQSFPGVIYAPEEISAPNMVWTNRPDPLFHKYKILAGRSNLKVFRKIDEQPH
ncbi:hypothetical protein BAC1_02138 [uncultured bacterium]|nr:hypothetical protein BAC1_02138 [uncultured bacterium]